VDPEKYGTTVRVRCLACDAEFEEHIDNNSLYCPDCEEKYRD